MVLVSSVVEIKCYIHWFCELMWRDTDKFVLDTFGCIKHLILIDGFLLFDTSIENITFGQGFLRLVALFLF